MSNKTPTANDLLVAALFAQGYQGLFNESANCACELDDLMLCGMEPLGCHAGWRHPDADQSEEILIWDQPPADPIAAGQIPIPGLNEEETE